MFHPLPVMRTTKVLGIITTLFILGSGVPKLFGVLWHPFFLFPAMICIFEVIAYRALSLKDSTFVTTKKLKKDDQISKKELDAFVRICINTKHFFIFFGMLLSLCLQKALFSILAAPAYIVFANFKLFDKKTPVPKTIRNRSRTSKSHRHTSPRMGGGRVYNSSLSKALGVDMWS